MLQPRCRPIVSTAEEGTITYVPRRGRGWTGLWVIFGYANPRMITAGAAVALGVHLFVVFYEEPTLRGKFGAAYEEYRHNVRRWWPRLRGWNQPLNGAA